MKNKYLEVEALPFALAQDGKQDFTLRALAKEYQNDAKEAEKKPKFWLIFARGIIVLLIFLFPQLSTGESFEDQLINLTNKERMKYDLPALQVDQSLWQAALTKGQDMIKENYFSHTSPDGKKAWHYLLDNKYDYLYAGENLAMDFSSPEKAFQAWLASPAHRSNILDKDYREIGLAVLQGELKGHPTTLIVQFFGTEK